MIQLLVEDGVAYVWKSSDWLELRSQHRICGALIGSVASYPRQNDFLGLPMALMSEETALLVNMGICELYSLSGLTNKPTEEQKNEIKTVEKRVLTEQTEALRKRKIEQLSQKIDIILAGKKQKLLSKGLPDVQLDKQTLLQEEINKLPNLAPAYTLVHLPTEHLWDTEKVKVTTASLEPSITDKEGSLQYSIFRDLWQKGFYITNGSKFGGHYLVYPGDPVKFHAMYIVRCVYDSAEGNYASDMVAFGRLSVAVNKMAVLAFCDGNSKISYQTLQWHESING